MTGLLDTAVPGLHAEHLIAVLRETLANTARHAHATTVDINAEATGAVVRLHVSDNGRGIDPAISRRSGLANLHARAQELGGTLTLAPNQPTGTAMDFTVPLPATSRLSSPPAAHCLLRGARFGLVAFGAGVTRYPCLTSSVLPTASAEASKATRVSRRTHAWSPLGQVGANGVTCACRLCGSPGSGGIRRRSAGTCGCVVMSRRTNSTYASGRSPRIAAHRARMTVRTCSGRPHGCLLLPSGELLHPGGPWGRDQAM
ncbi:sensor histidine kinase [Streptomyces sp. NBC_00827]|uniref:sensor histidine kinase n=1 Tax=Streptomyces sp. NBC_00827 TaxID=2903677 RepID=UPI003863A318